MVFGARGIGNRDCRHIGDARDGDVQAGHGGGGIALGFRRGGGDGQYEVSIGIVRRRDGKACQLSRSHGPRAVQIVGAGREFRA